MFHLGGNGAKAELRDEEMWMIDPEEGGGAYLLKKEDISDVLEWKV